MAQLKSTNVAGNLSVLGNTLASKFIKHGGTADELLLADGTTTSLATIMGNINAAITLKGSLGTGGTVTSLGAPGVDTLGHGYKVITAGTYDNKTAKIGDMFVCYKTKNNTYEWMHIPSGDDIEDTKNTAGSTNSSSKLFLIGATTQGDNPQTYSNQNVFIDASGNLVVNNGKFSGTATQADSATKLTTARTIRTNLGSTNTASFDGTASITPGVTGTLPVANGGTGATTFTSEQVLIGNGTSAVTTRAITNNTSKTAVTASTNLVTANTLYYHSGNSNITTVGTITSGTWNGTTIAIDKGGTGKTNAKDACNLFLNSLDTGNSDPTDNDYFISQYVSGGITTTTYHRRPVSKLYNYIQGKTDNRYLKLSGGTLTGNLLLSITGNTSNSRIQRSGISKAWYQGRDAAIIKTTSYVGYDALTSMKTTNGDWSMGVYSDDKMYFTYISDSNYNNNSNAITAQIRFDPNGNISSDSLESRRLTLSNKVSLQYDSTNECLNFVFN